MNNKFVAIVASIIFFSMMWIVLVDGTISEETFIEVGEDFCEQYSGIDEYYESIFGGLVLCNEWDPINKGIFGQDIKYQIRIEKDGQDMKNEFEFIMPYAIFLLIIGIILDKIFNKKQNDVKGRLGEQ